MHVARPSCEGYACQARSGCALSRCCCWTLDQPLSGTPPRQATHPGPGHGRQRGRPRLSHTAQMCGARHRRAGQREACRRSTCFQVVSYAHPSPLSFAKDCSSPIPWRPFLPPHHHGSPLVVVSYSVGPQEQPGALNTRSCPVLRGASSKEKACRDRWLCGAWELQGKQAAVVPTTSYSQVGLLPLLVIHR